MSFHPVPVALFLATAAADTITTRRAIRAGRRERKPLRYLIGEHPSVAALVAWGAAKFGLILGVLYLVDQWSFGAQLFAFGAVAAGQAWAARYNFRRAQDARRKAAEALARVRGGG